MLNIYNSLDYNRIYTTSENNFQETRSNLNQKSFGTSVSYSKALKNGSMSFKDYQKEKHIFGSFDNDELPYSD